MSSLLENSIIDVINNHYKFFSNKKNVIGIALGHKTTKNINTNIPCLHVFVTKKTPSNELYESDLIPPNFFGIKTDIIETGVLKLQTRPYNLINKFFTMGLYFRKRPLQPGYAIGAIKGPGFGTLGCIVYTRDKGKACILSNNHVLANLNKLKVGTEILQPPYRILGDSAPHLAGKLSKFSILLANPNNSTFLYKNSIDAAIAEIFPNIKYSKTIPKIGEVNGYTRIPEINTKIHKVGAGTGYSKGTITSINSIVNLELAKGRTYTFKDQILTTPMCSSGDSGSLAVDYSTNSAIGLYCGGNDSSSVFNPIFKVLTSLDVFFQ